MAEPATSLADAISDRFRLERELGRGGMATVYLARDLRHDRPIALKVLRPELSITLGATRFLREIQLTARLQHAGILPLFDSGEADGRLWYTMPYLEGGTLRDRLRREGQLSLEDALEIAQQVLAALAVAHAHGIVHRDIKPENILLAPGRAVVADFGIAQAVSAVGTERLTETGMAIGTAAYMSPEQATADRRLDGRSDLYSLACVLYEMLAGEPPYTGPTAQAIIAKRLSAPIPRLRTVRETVSPAVEQVITRALAKSPVDRFATAEQFASALSAAAAAPDSAPTVAIRVQRPARRWAAGLAVGLLAAAAGLWSWQRNGRSVPIAANVVAVLPFRVTAPDSSYNHLREGILDLINARLSRDASLRAVDSRTTMNRWRRAVAEEGGELATAGAVELGRGLGAGQVLLGEFVVTPSRITVSGRVLAVPDGRILAEHAEAARPGEVDELLLVDRWLGRVLAIAAGEDRARLPQLSDSTSAVQAYLAGRRAHRRGEWAAAFGHYARGLEIDSTFGLAAYYMAAVGANERTDWGRDAGRRAWELRTRLGERDRAQLAAEIAVGPNYPEPYTMSELIGAAERAVALNPNRAEAFERLGGLLLFQGAAAGIDFWLPRAVVALDSAITLDSTDGDAVWARLRAALIGRNRDDIRRFAAMYFDRNPSGDATEPVRWLVASALGDSAGLAAAEARLAELSSLGFERMLGYSVVSALPLGNVERAITKRFARPTAAESCDPVFHLMQIAALRGQVSRALAFADSASRLEGCPARRTTIALALAEPPAGYGSAAAEYARQLAAEPGFAESPDDQCYVELWRVSQGEAGSTRAAIERMTRLVREHGDHIPYPRVGRLGVCPAVLTAVAEARRSGGRASPAVDRLEQLMSRAPGLELPGNLANLMLARWFEARADTAAALRAVRRRVNGNSAFNLLFPAYLQEEGGLAALTGDTAGAIKAYEHYLALRDRPDAGPMAQEAQRVSAHLRELVSKR